MLNNTAWDKPKTEVQPQVDIMSAASLVAWLEKKPAEAPYVYDSATYCLLAQYFRENGKPVAMIGRTNFYPDGSLGKLSKLPGDFAAIAMGTPYTYGAALERARASLQKEQGNG